MKDIISYGRQSITEEDIEIVVETLQSDFLTQGPRIKEFEDSFAIYTGAKYAVAVSNGTAALHLCALALNVDETTNVITTPITFAASANCIRYCGGKVTFVDIDPDTALIDLNKVKRLLESSPKGTYQGIIPVDFMGYPVNMEELRKLADEYGLWIIEDACHAPGGSFTDSKGKAQICGNGEYADLSIFSFHPVKHMTTGEGGMITTNNEKLYKKLIMLRSHGITKEPDLMAENHGGWYYEMQMLGYNYRLPDINAALGISQLKKADKWLLRRREIAERYDNAFRDIKQITTFGIQKGFSHAYHLYVVQVDDRKYLYEQLRKKNIFTQVHYIPVHTMPYYKQLGWKYGDMPASERFYERCLSLPMYPGLTDEEQDYIISVIHELYK